MLKRKLKYFVAFLAKRTAEAADILRGLRTADSARRSGADTAAIKFYNTFKKLKSRQISAAAALLLGLCEVCR
mgnify:CR=1 FL=1